MMTGFVTFALAAITSIPLPSGFAPQTMAVGDFNGDGQVDVALCGNHEQLLVFAGGLHPIKQDARCGANPSAMIAADVDGDGRLAQKGAVPATVHDRQTVLQRRHDERRHQLGDRRGNAADKQERLHVSRVPRLAR